MRAASGGSPPTTRSTACAAGGDRGRPRGRGSAGAVATFDYDLVGNKILETNVCGQRDALRVRRALPARRKNLPQAGPTFGTEIRQRQGGQPPLRQGRQRERDEVRVRRPEPPTKTTNALGQITTVTYLDPEGSKVNKSEEHDQTRGLRTTYRYDALNRETERKVHLEGAGAAGEVYTTLTAYSDDTHSLTVTDPRLTVTETSSTAWTGCSSRRWTPPASTS